MIESIKETKREDIIIARAEGDANLIVLTRYGIHSFPIIVLFEPGSKKPKLVFNGMRTEQKMKEWVLNNAPAVQVKKEPEKKNKTDEENLDIGSKIKNKENMTKEIEFITNEYTGIKKRLESLENSITELKKFRDAKKKNKKILIELDLSKMNCQKGIIVLVSLFILYVFFITVKKIKRNLKTGTTKEL